VTDGIHLVPDSFKVLRESADPFCDIVITDPPYDQHCMENQCSGSLVGKQSVPKVTPEFAHLDGVGFVADLLRVSRRWVVVFGTLEELGRIKLAYPLHYVRGSIWYKPNAMGQLTRDRPATAYEGIAILHSRSVKKRWNGKGSFGIWKCNGTRGLKGRHPNEKPIDLCLKLVSLFSERGEVVLDPFCGSGAIGEACARLGRTYEGWDKDPRWVDRASSRMHWCVPSKGQSKSSPMTWDVTDGAALALCRMKDAT